MTRRRVLLTGGSRGIGAAVQKLFESQGHEVFAPGRDLLDLGDAGSVQHFCGSHQADYDILVNNAGINVLNELGDLQLVDWQAMVQVNLTSPLLLIQWACEGMKAAQWGRIVNISSIFSTVTKEGRTAYTTTKSGLNGLTRSVAVELAPYNIMVNALGPGYVETEMTRRNNTPEQLQAISAQIPAGRLARPEEIAQWVSFLCDEKNTYLTGQFILADGGFTCR